MQRGNSPSLFKRGERGEFTSSQKLGIVFVMLFVYIEAKLEISENNIRHRKKSS
jgi:hypothetical protein